jgi:hypothetical protein
MTNHGKTLMRVAWLSIALGLFVEAVILIVSTVFDKELEARPVLADTIQKVSWSVIVCIGLALGRGAARLLAMQKESALMGLAGLLAAPVAFAVARSVHEGIQEALFIKVFAGGGGSPVMLALIKGLEYGCLGALLGWLATKPWGRATAHVMTGLAVGTVFGCAVLAIMLSDNTTPPTAGTLISRGLNELIYPAGCSLTLYAAEILGRNKLAPAEA